MMINIFNNLNRLTDEWLPKKTPCPGWCKNDVHCPELGFFLKLLEVLTLEDVSFEGC
jgi:hypothetical protein